MRLRIPGITQFYPSHIAQSRPVAGAGHCLPVAGRSQTLHSLHGGARSIGSESGAAAVTSQMWYLHPRALTLTPCSFPRTKGVLGSHVTPWGPGPGLDPVSMILPEGMGVPPMPLETRHGGLTSFPTCSQCPGLQLSDSSGSQKPQISFTGLQSRHWRDSILSGGLRGDFVSLPFQYLETVCVLWLTPLSSSNCITLTSASIITSSLALTLLPPSYEDDLH